MKAVKKWIYYCDFCKKSGRMKPPMERHEKGCTSNPDRECGLCFKGQMTQRPMAELLETYEKYGVEKLRELTENCPNCILSTLKAFYREQLKVDEDIFWYEIVEDFNYKTELQGFWDDYNDDENPY